MTRNKAIIGFLWKI